MQTSAPFFSLTAMLLSVLCGCASPRIERQESGILIACKLPAPMPHEKDDLLLQVEKRVHQNGDSTEDWYLFQYGVWVDRIELNGKRVAVGRGLCDGLVLRLEDLEPGRYDLELFGVWTSDVLTSDIYWASHTTRANGFVRFNGWLGESYGEHREIIVDGDGKVSTPTAPGEGFLLDFAADS